MIDTTIILDDVESLNKYRIKILLKYDNTAMLF